jgi:hypothetical protein
MSPLNTAIIAVLLAEPSHPWRASELARRLGAPRDEVEAELKALAVQGRARRRIAVQEKTLAEVWIGSKIEIEIEEAEPLAAE